MAGPTPIPENFLRLKRRAFTANRRAKASNGQAREAFYRVKAAAINTLLKAGCAFVNDVDWSVPDAVIGITFLGGGDLHTTLSALDLVAFRIFRLQLTGDRTAQNWTSQLDSDQSDGHNWV